MDNWANSSSSTTSSSSITCSSSNMFLKQPNKNSHKISKPIRKPLPAIDPNPQFPGPSQPQHPAVYNINRNDFRDVVQKLTGSPAHERQQQPPPPPITHPRPPNSRLQRIRPPPLSQIGNRQNRIAQIHQQRPQFNAGAAETPISAYMRFLQNPTSPLWNSGQRPSPFSPRHPPEESPISAYMRFFQNSASPSAPSPMWNGGPRPASMVPPPFSPRFPQSPGAPRLPQPLTPPGAFTSSYPAMPLSPPPFGCIPSPWSPYGMMSPGFLFAPMGQQLGFPQLPPSSPTFLIPSPRWKGI